MADGQSDPEYLLVRTEHELDRLRKQHRWLQLCNGGKIVFAPVDLKKQGLKVLDVGCADGTLLRDLQEQVSPSAYLVGTDFMPSFVQAAKALSPNAANLEYRVHDLSEPFPPDLISTFDLTHVRLVLPGVGRVGLEATVRNLLDTVAPGGWLQVQEMHLQPETAETQSMKDILSLFGALFKLAGLPENFSSKLQGIFQDVGLEDVTVQKIAAPLGKKLGLDMEGTKMCLEPFEVTIPSLIVANQGKAKPSSSLPTSENQRMQANRRGNLGSELPKSTTDNLKERFHTEMLETGGTFYNLVVSGRKKGTDNSHRGK
ncbi:S-adenosyl-L-methionine-dependent methyltransferase [Xylariales sp. PMI_506]|nr:S-adenosyl-L-methionine-dependent methyltransferase [Xylariales sp. PMI_506]